MTFPASPYFFKKFLGRAYNVLWKVRVDSDGRYFFFLVQYSTDYRVLLNPGTNGTEYFKFISQSLLLL